MKNEVKINESDKKPEFNTLEEPTPDLKEDLSKVSAAPRQKFLIWSLLGLLASYLLFYFFVLRKAAPTNQVGSGIIESPGLFSTVAKPSISGDDTSEIPRLPSIPKLYEPSAAPPPPPPNVSTSTTRIIREMVPLPTLPTPQAIAALPTQSGGVAANIQPNKNDEEQKRLDAKRRSGIIKMGGSPIQKTPEQIQQAADFVNRGDTGLLLPRGKIIEAVVETAMNSDFGGEVRAIVARDVYAAAGNKILIPKGSNIFGQYSAGLDGLYARVAINWSRIDLAHSNYSVNIASPSIDNLGKAGVEGDLDNKYKEKIANVVLSSAFNILLARGLDKMVPPALNVPLANSNQALASQLNNIALGIFSDPSKTPDSKIPLICTQILAALTDKTSQAYISFSTTCTNVTVAQTGVDAMSRLNSLMAAVSSTSSLLISNVSQQVTPTQAQQASKQAFIDVSNSMKDIIIRDLPKATVTIDQGTHVKIYVNKDYNFPKAALAGSAKIK